MHHFFKHIALIIELTKREFFARYLGSFIGGAWTLIHPLFLLTVYTVAFGIILKRGWGNGVTASEYALLLFAGLIIFNTFAEVFTKSPTVILANPNFVKKIVFPLELLLVVQVISAFANAAICIFIWLIGYWLIIGTPHASILFLPLIFLSFTPLLLGFGWLISALGVFIRDLGPITSIISHSLLFLTPIFYSIDEAPELFRKILWFNPLTLIVEQLRVVLFFGGLPSFGLLLLFFIFATAFSILCLFIFLRLKPNFGDVL